MERWPPLPWEEWQDTAATLHMEMQVVGKTTLALAPFLNEWWEVAFAVTARGMTTGLIPYSGGAFQVDFDFLDSTLLVHVDDGATRRLPLAARTIADFYATFMSTLTELGIQVSIDPTPAEVPDPVPFDQNRLDCAYDPDAALRWWRIQVETAKVLQRYRSPFVGKSSPIHFFWGSFDLAHSRFSGRPAPAPPGAPRFFQIAEDQENVSCGFWPGNTNAMGVTYGAPAFYSYIYPAPEGYQNARVRPESASFDANLGEFVLPYEAVRTAQSPAEDLLTFFQSTYEAAADLAGWDRTALEKPVPIRTPRT